MTERYELSKIEIEYLECRVNLDPCSCANEKSKWIVRETIRGLESVDLNNHKSLIVCDCSSCSKVRFYSALKLLEGHNN